MGEITIKMFFMKTANYFYWMIKGISSVKFMVAITFSCCFFSCETALEERTKQGYKGIIVKKFNRHGPTLRIKTNTGKTIQVGLLESDLTIDAMVGDSIHKIKDKNVCILNHKGAKDVYRYAYDRNKYKYDKKGKPSIKPEKRVRRKDYIEYLR